MQKNIRILALALSLAILASLTGCATGGGGSRGSLSQATAESAGQKEATDRDEGRTRTKNDTNTSNTSNYSSNDDDDYYYEEEESGGGGGFLVGMIMSLFSRDDDDEESQEAPDYYPHLTDYSETGNRTWANNEEVGLYDADESDGDDDGGGLDIKRGNLNFWYSRSQLAGDAIKSFSTFTVMFSGYTGPRYRAHAGLYFGRGKAGSQPNVRDGLRWISEAGIDVGSRGYFTPDHSLLGVYMLVGLRAGILYWSYNTALDATAADGTPEKISKDGLGIFTPYIGLGTSLLQSKTFHLGVNFTVGGRLTINHTLEGYENDIFKHVAEYKLNIEASIFF